MSIELDIEVEKIGFRLDVCLHLEHSGITAIYGVSGAGKTTLLRSIAGLEPTTLGYIKIDGELWQDSGFFLPAHKRSVGYIFQEPSLFEHLDIVCNIEYGFKRVELSKRKISTEQVISLLNLEPLLLRKPHQLSGGEQQRVAIARAILTNPSILLLDEPLSALNIELKEEILGYLKQLNRALDIPMFYVTHSLWEMKQLATDALLLRDGEVDISGTIDDICRRVQPHSLDTIEAEVVKVQTDLIYLKCNGVEFTLPYRDIEVGAIVKIEIDDKMTKAR